MSDKTKIGDRMKRYEASTHFLLPRRTYTIIRVDGKAFHSYCRKYDKPFDAKIHACMDRVARALVNNFQGAILSYHQSDECSLLLYDFENINSEAYYDGNVQKLASVAASNATAHFNNCMTELNSDEISLALFDARVFTIPDPAEVANYFIWRQQDATRNSISSAARSVYSHKELNEKGSNAMQDMLMEKGINWNDYSEWFKRGSLVSINEGSIPIPIFTQDPNFLLTRIPRH